jgi:hypothetical protein
VWSHEEARDIHDWVQWARRVGPAIADESISLNSVMSGFLLPEEAKERPPYVPLAVEWPYELMATISASRSLSHVGQAYTFLDSELQLIDHTSTGPLAFEVVTPGWRLGYEYVFQTDELPVIRPLGDDGQVTTPKGAESLSAFLTRNGLQVTFEDDLILVARGYLLRPDRARHLFPSDALQPIDWAGIDITKESQGSGRDPSTVQYRAIEVLASEEDWEVVIDDDGTGELADVALMRRRDDDLEVLLVHCKFSSKPEPGARIEDLYDVCGQAMKMNRAKSIPDQLARRLFRREQDRQAKGRTGIIRGDVSLLGKIVQEARHRRLDVTVAIVQPGASKALMSDDMRALLGATERFLMETYGMKLRVLCSS